MRISDYKRIAIVGSRDFHPLKLVKDGIMRLPPDVVIISGRGGNVDQMAEAQANLRKLTVEPYPADWDDLSHPDAIIRTGRGGKKYDAKAGIRRNKVIAEKCEILVAYWDGISRGTRSTIDFALALGKPVIVIDQGGKARWLDRPSNGPKTTSSS